MLLKDNLLKEILGQINLGIEALQRNDIKEADVYFRAASTICLAISMEDLDVSQSHIDAVMKQKKYSDETDALKYLLYQIRDFTLKGIVGNLLALSILCFVEELNIRKMQRAEKSE